MWVQSQYDSCKHPKSCTVQPHIQYTHSHTLTYHVCSRIYEERMLETEIATRPKPKPMKKKKCLAALKKDENDGGGDGDGVLLLLLMRSACVHSITAHIHIIRWIYATFMCHTDCYVCGAVFFARFTWQVILSSAIIIIVVIIMILLLDNSHSFCHVLACVQRLI